MVEGSRAGQRVTKIGGVATEDVFRGLERFISRDNEMQFRWAVPFYATVPSFLAAAGVKPVLTFEDGSTAALDAEPIDLEKLELKLIPQNAHGDTFRMEEIAPGVLYIAVNSMSGGVEEFGRNLRTRLAGFDRAILDLRLNNGGDALKADELMKTLIAFDARGGKFVTLTSRMTFSAAQTFAARIDQWTATTFVGEATGSRPNHYGNERPFELPHSGLRGSISSGWNQPITSRDERETIRPDVAVPQLASDFFAGRDPGLQAALAHLARHVEE